jgi:hypothetical protein
MMIKMNGTRGGLMSHVPGLFVYLALLKFTTRRCLSARLRVRRAPVPQRAMISYAVSHRWSSAAGAGKVSRAGHESSGRYRSHLVGAMLKARDRIESVQEQRRFDSEENC